MVAARAAYGAAQAALFVIEVSHEVRYVIFHYHYLERDAREIKDHIAKPSYASQIRSLLLRKNEKLYQWQGF